MLVGDLRAQAIYLVIAARDANQLRAKHLGAENLGGFEIRRNKNPGFEAIARSLSGHGVGKVSG